MYLMLIEILYPERRAVDIEQIRRWASDDLFNEEGRELVEGRIPDEFALAIVHHHGSVTLAKGHGFDLPEYAAGDSIPHTTVKKYG